MSSIDRAFRATADEMGQWDGYDRADDPIAETGRAEQIQSLAWDRFCETHDQESWEALGRRVAAFVNGY